ncbi:biofilm formation and stress response factor family protein [Collimonas arenae]|uniref:Biofilm formation and stress response factor family protein n=1 Tax=Collimonas arenae TaxID=279058 RepID=A0A127QIC0_9BURK|nr:2OG-Fe dioxygenase family protein [Collimonas arenae]AMO99451.1 biofilm formation and stress response factor family protein [Collimonas arenae]AMP09352.1 biofilm formation and stress response factor family protein [Collimonas arenae]
MEIDALAPIKLAPPIIDHLSSEVEARLFSVLSGRALQAACDVDPATWDEFAACWNNLPQDRYMGDNGSYRFRRYGAFELDHAEGVLHQLPHGPYQQPGYINKLNGDVARHFEPLERHFVESPFLSGLLLSLAQVFDQVQGRGGRWNIRLHPYRIRASAHTPGNPTPEGLHRDGVDYIVTMMVRRHNVLGGETYITDVAGKLMCRYTLTDPMDLMLADDARTMHGVTKVLPLEPKREAFRDVLVIAYTRT